MERMKERFFCGAGGMFSRRKACYIMTIGVIDECRKLGIGTQMLDYTIDLIEQTFEHCLAIYLHVADYNQAAIKFYEKHEFRKVGTRTFPVGGSVERDFFMAKSLELS